MPIVLSPGAAQQIWPVTVILVVPGRENDSHNIEDLAGGAEVSRREMPPALISSERATQVSKPFERLTSIVTGTRTYRLNSFNRRSREAFTTRSRAWRSTGNSRAALMPYRL